MVDVVARIEQMRFTTVQIREGYDIREVDDLLDEAVELWHAGQPLAPLVDGAHLARGRWRSGYHIGEVDKFLAWLRTAPTSPTPAVSSSAVVGSSAPKGLAHRVRNVQFTPVGMREGYDMREVDQLLDTLERAARTGTPLAPLIQSARFNRVRLREGYDMGEGDAFLEELRLAR